MTNQRSKSGCWTCRLRRKKCPEDGLPCSNCESRGVDCHGYGPRPAWKDRGHQERQEAERLRLLRRSSHSHSRRHSNAADVTEVTEHGIPCLSPSITFVSPSDLLQSSSFPPPNTEAAIFPISPSALHTSDLLPEFWVPDFEEPGLTPNSCHNSSTALDNHPSNVSNTPGGTPLALPVMALDFPSIQDQPLEEREIELMMQFLGEDFPKQHPSHQSLAMSEKAWVMCMFTRSSTFLYASIGTSAYFNFLKAPAHDSRRTDFFREYDRYRHIAKKGHNMLLEESRENCQPSAHFLLSETIICSVQLAILESLGENHHDTWSHLDSASCHLVKYYENGLLAGAASYPQPTILPAASAMERKAVEYFTCILIWIHILHCSTQQVMPKAGNLYRQLLSTNSPFVSSFFQIVGFEGWVFIALMDAIDVSVWKREQEAKKSLSMRELVSKTDVIVSTVNQQIQQGEHVQTHIFAHAIVIRAHTITSGYLSAIPEIQQTLDKAIPLWQRLSPSQSNLKRLSWAFCVSASLASGEQRAVFGKILSDAKSADPVSSTMVCLNSLVEECWKMLDSGAPSCNWESVMQKLERNIHSTIFT